LQNRSRPRTQRQLFETNLRRRDHRLTFAHPPPAQAADQRVKIDSLTPSKRRLPQTALLISIQQPLPLLIRQHLPPPSIPLPGFQQLRINRIHPQSIHDSPTPSQGGDPRTLTFHVRDLAIDPATGRLVLDWETPSRA